MEILTNRITLGIYIAQKSREEIIKNWNTVYPSLYFPETIKHVRKVSSIEFEEGDTTTIVLRSPEDSMAAAGYLLGLATFKMVRYSVDVQQSIDADSQAGSNEASI
jgi:hypothetical protein